MYLSLKEYIIALVFILLCERDILFHDVSIIRFLWDKLVLVLIVLYCARLRILFDNMIIYLFLNLMSVHIREVFG